MSATGAETITQRRAGRSARRVSCFALAALCALCAQGCRSVRYDPGVPVSDAALAQSLRQVVAARYPPSFRARHRVLADIRGREFPWTGHVRAEATGDLRLVAVADFTGTVFDVARNADGRVRILRNPSGLKPRWLERGAARDAAAIYLARPSPRATLVRHGARTLGLADDLPDGTRHEFRFDAQSRRLIGFLIARRNRCLYEATFSDEAAFPDWPTPAPRTIRITDHALKYHLAIQVLSLDGSATGPERPTPKAGP